MRHDSTEYLYIPITTPVGDIVGDAVEVAFELDPDSVPTEWYPADIVGTDVQVLIGPGDGSVIQLTPGIWYPIVKITDSPEIPIVSAGSLTIS